MQTVQMEVGSNVNSSFVMFRYERSETLFYETFQYYMYGSTMAGFSAGDGVR